MNNIDLKYYKKGIRYLAGVDEAGRGPLAGPVVAASVILPQDFYHSEINDSKKLTHKQREKLFDIIISNAVSYSFSVISQDTIDKINILNSSLLAMKKSVLKLKPLPELVLVDGNKIFNSDLDTLAIVKGDTQSQSIAAASIVAKVIRDRMMIRLSDKYPEYKWGKNKGYPTKSHIEAIMRFGVTPVHRKSFLTKIFEKSFQKDLKF